MGTKYLSDAIDYERDIEPYPFLQIFAGVGSGKNTFIERIIKGDPERHIPKQTVLLITSRKAKVEETLPLDEDDLPIGKSIGRWGNMHRVLDDADDPAEYSDYLRILKSDWGERSVYQKSVVCTNAFIERYLQYVYDPQDISTHLWELFDLIVVDEVHSLVLDSTYQSAPYYIRELIHEYNSRVKNSETKPACKHLILMTGTPKSIQTFKCPVTLDKFDECINVVPKEVRFIESDNVKKQIEGQLQDGKKVLYFTNHVILPSAFCLKTSIDPDHVAISFSDKTRRSNLKSDDEETFNRMERTENSIRDNSLIPDDIHLFITTSRNKEGINITNEDFQYTYVESHNYSDVIQMAGRIRKGVDCLYIVVDSKGYGAGKWRLDADFCNMEIACKSQDTVTGAANEYLKALCQKLKLDLYNDPEASTTAYSNKMIGAYIDYIHEKFPFVRYSYFKNIFEFYGLKKKGHIYQQDNNDAFMNAGMTAEPYKDLAQSWFPTAKVYPFTSKEVISKQMLLAFLGNDPDRLVPEQDIEELVAQLNTIWGSDLGSINPLMKKFTSATFERGAKDKSRRKYHFFKYTQAVEAEEGETEGEN